MGAAATCGDFGGRTKAQEPCGKPAGWGRKGHTGRCRLHALEVNAPNRSLTWAHEAPAPPEHLSARATGLWEDIARRWVLTADELGVLEGALTAFDRAAEARRDIEVHGLVTRDTSTPHANPSVRVERDALREYRLALKQLGLESTPGGE
jgi:phage terminase small subunit